VPDVFARFDDDRPLSPPECSRPDGGVECGGE